MLSEEQMEALNLVLVTVGLMGAGCLATVASAYVYPLAMRVRGQAHGRFAGLSTIGAPAESGSVCRVDGSGPATTQVAAPNLIVA
jgi:hypothetical protein